MKEENIFDDMLLGGEEEKTFDEGSVELSALALALNRIYKTVKKNGFSKSSADKLDSDIGLIAGHFGIDRKGAILLASITESGEDGVDAGDLSEFLGCSNIEFMGFQPSLKELEAKGIATTVSGRRRRMSNYTLTREAIESIESDGPFTPVCWSGISTSQLFSRFRIYFQDQRAGSISQERLLESIIKLINLNPELEFSKQVLGGPLLRECPATEQRMFFYLCHRLVSFGESSVPIERLMDMTGFMEDEQCLKRELKNEERAIQKNGLVCFESAGGFKDTDNLCLTEETVKSYLGEIKLMTEAKKRERDVVKAADITARDLFYNRKESEQLDRLAALMDDANFKGVQARLEEMGFRKGFAVLFSGGAGTGKTAGVYELARRTGRDVFAVDMSRLKSCWVGESEKIVKSVFTYYAELCRTRDKAPILLFNEADAIFAKRIETPRDSVDQMMNAIQNICLDAIENLNGILIATTNLAENFCDDAFARRFILKVNFTTPVPDVRAKIWRSMIPTLSEEDALTLGTRYPFSGGNIENVARKSTVGYVLSGKKAGLDEIMKYCDEENLASRKTRNRIGFGE